MEAVHAVPYDKNQFMWGLMYQAHKGCKPHIVRMYPRGRDAQREANRTNTRWREQGFKDDCWSVKRFKFYYRGAEIDAYEHDWERTEANKIITALRSLLPN